MSPSKETTTPERSTEAKDGPCPDEEHEAAPRPQRYQIPHGIEQHYGQAIQTRGGAAFDDPGRVQEAATEGTAGAGSSLPHLDRLQQSFGPEHDLSGVRAHVGAAASAASAKMGALAFATGDDVAFRGEPDLHTVAHEAAHVVQQRSGIQLAGGVGQAGDFHERHADEVADRVTAGKPAGELLRPYASGSKVSSVQRRAVQRLVEPGEKKGTPVFVTGTNGILQGTIFEEVSTGYKVQVEGEEKQNVYRYSQLNRSDPRNIGLPKDEKWREYIRGKDQKDDKDNSKAYDGDGEQFKQKKKGMAYSTSMQKAQGTVTNSLGKQMTPTNIKQLHDQTMEHLDVLPNWRDTNGITIDLLQTHADPEGIKSLQESKTMHYASTGGEQHDGSGQMVVAKAGHQIAPMSMSEDEIQEKLKTILATYYAVIQGAQSYDTILDAIARFTQDLARLHPFRDANTRTNMMLLNKLLAENGLPMAIVNDPKNFYLNSLKSWRAKIEDGMESWKQAGGKGGANLSPAQAGGGGAANVGPAQAGAAPPSQDLRNVVLSLEARNFAIQSMEHHVRDTASQSQTYARLMAKASEDTGKAANHVEGAAAQTEQFDFR